MSKIPNSERIRFESLVAGRAKEFQMTSSDYLRKIWYHEQAAQLGEYVALSLVDDLVHLLPPELDVGVDDMEGDQTE